MTQNSVWHAVLTAAAQASPTALDNAPLVSNLCADLAPDDPDAEYLLRTAAEFGVARRLRELIAHGFSGDSAVRTVAGLLTSSRYIPPAVSLALVTEFATVHGFAVQPPTITPSWPVPPQSGQLGASTSQYPTAHPSGWSSLPQTQGRPQAQAWGQPAAAEPPRPSQKRPRWFVPVMATIVLIAVIAGGVAVYASQKGGSGKKAPAAVGTSTTSTTVVASTTTVATRAAHVGSTSTTVGSTLSLPADAYPTECGTVPNSYNHTVVEVAVLAGNVSCDTANSIVNAYFNDPSVQHQGSGSFSEIDGWTCSSRVVDDNPDAPLDGCSGPDNGSIGIYSAP